MTSKGQKRLASALLVIVGTILSAFGLDLETIIIEYIAGTLGAIGIGHALKANTIASKKLVTIAAACAVFLALVPFVPALAPYAPLVQKIAAIIATIDRDWETQL